MTSDVEGSEPILTTFCMSFLTLTRLKISTIRFDGASEFGNSFSFIDYCQEYGIVRETVVGQTHDHNARAEGVIRICKELVRGHSLSPSQRQLSAKVLT